MGFEIDLLPVGSKKKSGDCIVIRYGDLVKGGDKQTVIVIDGGYKNTWEDTLKPHLKQYSNCIIDKKIHIDLVILSHTDQDHVSGLVEMINDEEVTVDMLMMHTPWTELTPKWFKDGRITKSSLKDRIGDAFEIAKDLDDAASAKKISRTYLEPGSYRLNDATITILGPSSDFYKTCIANCEKTPDQDENVENMPKSGTGSNEIEYEPYVKGKIKWNYAETTSPVNESSLILLLKYEKTKVLLTGDAGKQGLTNAIQYANDNKITLNDCTIIKMPHHGSRKNVDPEIMDNFIGSDKLFYSCASDDLGHHPSTRLINMLYEKGFKLQKSTSGATLHWGKDAPDRHWKKADNLPLSDKIDK